MDIDLHVMTTGLSDATVAHIHRGAAGVNGDVEIPLERNSENDEHWLVSGTFSEAQYEAFRAADLYINVHSETIPSGEIRGQLVP